MKTVEQGDVKMNVPLQKKNVQALRDTAMYITCLDWRMSTHQVANSSADIESRN